MCITVPDSAERQGHGCSPHGGTIIALSPRAERCTVVVPIKHCCGHGRILSWTLGRLVLAPCSVQLQADDPKQPT